MGQAKERQKATSKTLLEFPNCCYCGRRATTIDHCPPRCFFVKRNWPEGYAFSSCEACNSSTRHDEQLLAVLSRISVGEDRSINEEVEWRKLLRGVRNNYPDVIDEWSKMPATRLKRYFRDSFGQSGDALRHAGWGAVNLGPKTKSALHRFLMKLAKALYFKHVGRRCDGTITWAFVDTITDGAKDEYLENILRISPVYADVQRNKIDLSDQFIYRFNASSEIGALHAIVRFSEQFLFHIIVLSKSASEETGIRDDGKFTFSTA